MIDLNEKDKALICDILGYLNFSSGSLDVRFLRSWNLLYESLISKGSTEVWRDALDALRLELGRLSANGGVFKNSSQSLQALEGVGRSLIEYRQFHRDTLFHLSDSYLFNPFFMARACRLVTTEIVATGTSADPGKIVSRLNDFIGYRPIPVLDDGVKHEPNGHEWIAPIPLYYRDAGVACGKYRNVVETALAILSKTDSDILFDASFDPDKLVELALDPRAYDFDNPVNHRINYGFGTWDDRSVDKDGFFRRFVVQRTTVDSIMTRVWNEQNPELRSEYEYEAAAVLAGTILMASGVSGGYVQAHDSTVSLGTLATKVAAYRDAFYEKLIKKVPKEFGERLKVEEAQLFQPFAGARQALNRQLAKKSADQLQRFALARTYARMGYFEASKRQADVIETTSARLLSRIDCLITEAHLKADAGKIREGAACMPKIEELLRRGLACGAFPDPWFILGFDSQFNLFPSVENGVHDHRLDSLIDLLNDIFDLYSRLQKEAAATGDDELRWELSDQMSDLAGWWDQYGSTEVSSVEGFSGQEAWESAAKVSTALAAWNQAGKAIGDVAFWRKRVERFKSPKAFVLLGEALLDKNDLISASSLLIYWLDQSPTIPLVEGDYSFHSLANYWMEQVWHNSSDSAIPASQRRRNASSIDVKWSAVEYLKRWNMTKIFLDRIEANADEYWETPTLELSEEKFEPKLAFETDNPFLADFARRLILTTRCVRQKDGSQKITVKASLRDAARVFNAQNLPSPEELEKFYLENRSVFPKYVTYYVFMEIIIGAVSLPTALRKKYHEYVFGRARNSFTISDPTLAPEGAADASIGNAKELEKKKIWNELINSLKVEEDDAEIAENIQYLMSGKNANEATEAENKDDSSLSDISFLGEDDDDSYDDDHIEGDDDETITGGDPTFRAAYDHMSFRDSADDGVDEDVESGNGAYGKRSEGDDFELAQETDRISDRLTFLYSTVKLWKFAASKSPLLSFHTDESLDDEVIADARLRFEEWLKQAEQFARDLYELLDQASRVRIPKPSGTADSLAEYDQLRGTKEILLDRVIWTIVEVEDAVLYLKAMLRDETPEPYEKPWKSTALQTLGAVFRRDVQRVRALWPTLVERLKTETLLYVPTARGGDAKAIVECRRLQQIVARLLDFAPKLGLLTETFKLIECVQKMEQIRLSSPGSITEYDRFVESAMRSLTETLAESSKTWNVENTDFNTADDALVSNLNRATSVVLRYWLQHSQQILISSVERIVPERQWNMIREFIQKYGADLFTQQFLAFRNLRAILHQGTANFLATLAQMKRDDKELECGDSLITAIMANEINFEDAAGMLEETLECVAENYSEYIDYNSTTTQSDRGEKLFTFLDFLRVLSRYERISWNLKPVYWTHDSLIRSRKPAAELWKENVKEQSVGQAQKILSLYADLNKRYGIWLQSVYERLREQFVRPLEVAQMCGLVFDAISEARVNGEDNPTFKQLETMVETFAAEPCGVGFELPDWLTELQDEVMLSRVDSKEEQRLREPKDEAFEPAPFPIEPMRLEDVESQIQRILPPSK